MSSYLDILPGNEREKIRKKLRSPEAYERLRERVKGPEDLEKEMRRSEQLAEAHFLMESESNTKESMKATVAQALNEQGMENVLELDDASPDARTAIGEGMFSVNVASHPVTHEDALVVMTEGTVQEKVPVRISFSDRFVGHLLGHDET